MNRLLWRDLLLTLAAGATQGCFGEVVTEGADASTDAGAAQRRLWSGFRSARGRYGRRCHDRLDGRGLERVRIPRQLGR
jgi:hypothetical protein